MRINCDEYMSQTDRILRKINAKNDRRSAQPLEKWRTWVKGSSQKARCAWTPLREPGQSSGRGCGMADECQPVPSWREAADENRRGALQAQGRPPSDLARGAHGPSQSVRRMFQGVRQPYSRRSSCRAPDADSLSSIALSLTFSRSVLSRARSASSRPWRSSSRARSASSWVGRSSPMPGS